MKKVLITGGATGIGKATAQLFKQKGYDVFITYNQSEPDFDGITKIKCNLENENEIIELFNQITSIDVLVNNAGISLIKQINDTTAEEYDKIMRINARSYFLCSREAVKLMLKSHSGAIVNVSCGVTMILQLCSCASFWIVLDTFAPMQTMMQAAFISMAQSWDS